MTLQTWRWTDADENIEKIRKSIKKNVQEQCKKCPREDLKPLMYDSDSYDTYD